MKNTCTMNTNILNLYFALLLITLLGACGKKDTSDPIPQQQQQSQGVSFNLKEFIGVYDATMVNYATELPMVISRATQGFQGNQVWIGSNWDGTNGAKVMAELTEGSVYSDVVVKIPNQTLNDSLAIEGEGTFYYYKDDFYFDVDYTIINKDKTTAYGLVAIKKVYTQNVIINIDVNCECECVCDGTECDCACTCDQ